MWCTSFEYQMHLICGLVRHTPRLAAGEAHPLNHYQVDFLEDRIWDIWGNDSLLWHVFHSGQRSAHD